MKIDHRKKSPVKKILIIASLIVLAGAITVYALVSRSTQESSRDDTNPTQEQINAGNATKSNTIENGESNNKPSSGSDTPTTAPAGSIEVSIPYADPTRLTVLIDAVVSGTCTLKITKGSETITDSAPIQAGPNSSTCQGFNYRALSSGEWTASVTVNTSSANGSTTKTINVE